MRWRVASEPCKPREDRVKTAFDRVLLSRVDDACINACTPSRQRWLDGWLVRFSPEKARRARCVHTLAPGLLGFEAKLALCESIYREAGLPIHFRVTPFSQPGGVDLQLAAAGLHFSAETSVMVLRLGRAGAVLANGAHVEALEPSSFAELVGTWRGSPAQERNAQATRLVQSPVPCSRFLLRDADGASVACGQVAIEGELIGLYDVHTAEAYRGRGLARALCGWLLGFGAQKGATIGYLQVEIGNEAALRLYRSLGFVDAYHYHYRARPG